MGSFNLAIEILFFSSHASSICSRVTSDCFNLAIEILFFSRCVSAMKVLVNITFQSRNRDTFLFKMRVGYEGFGQYHVSISQSRYFSFQGVPIYFYIQDEMRFNLAIEILFFSSKPIAFSAALRNWFQSRNRDTFLFKWVVFEPKYRVPTLFQSRNRDTFLFKRNSMKMLRIELHRVSISQSRYFSFQECPPSTD